MAATPHVLMTVDAVGGVWSYAVALARELAGTSLHFTFATFGPPPDREQRAMLAGLPVDVHTADYRLEWQPDVGDELKRSGEWLLKRVDELQPSLVHVNGFAHAGLPFECPSVLAAHSCVLTWWRAVKGVQAPPEWDDYRRRARAGLAAADVLVAPTHAMADGLRREHGCAREVLVIENGTGPAPPRRRAKEPIIVSAGRVWDSAKNIRTLDQAAGHVSWPVFVPGDLHAPDGTRHDVQFVHTLGRLSPAKTREWMARAAIYAHPALYEPFGLSVLEAARERCALVLGDIQSLRELWDGAAIFVEPSDPRQLAEVLGDLVGDPARREELSAAAFDRAGRFGSPRMGAAYLRLYQALCTPRQASAAVSDHPGA